MPNRSTIRKWLEGQHGKIRKWASAMSHKLDSADVDDVVQTVSLELLIKDKKIKQPEAFARSLTAYRVYDLLRQRAKAPRSLEPEEDPGQPDSFSGRSLRVLQKPDCSKERCLDFWKAMSQLSSLHQSILLQRLVEERTFAAIANQQRLPESTVRHHYSEAVEQLGKSLHYVTLTGVVTDDDAKSLAAVEVTARGVRIQEYRRTTTDRHGQFCMVLLQKGRYSLRAVKAGFTSMVRHLDLYRDIQLPAIVLARAHQIVEAWKGSSRDE
jgi:RNA polymerase sigma factor (sigma-70 family)